MTDTDTKPVTDFCIKGTKEINSNTCSYRFSQLYDTKLQVYTVVYNIIGIRSTTHNRYTERFT